MNSEKPIGPSECEQPPNPLTRRQQLARDVYEGDEAAMAQWIIENEQRVRERIESILYHNPRLGIDAEEAFQSAISRIWQVFTTRKLPSDDPDKLDNLRTLLTYKTLRSHADRAERDRRVESLCDQKPEEHPEWEPGSDDSAAEKAAGQVYGLAGTARNVSRLKAIAHSKSIPEAAGKLGEKTRTIESFFQWMKKRARDSVAVRRAVSKIDEKE